MSEDGRQEGLRSHGERVDEERRLRVANELMRRLADADKQLALAEELRVKYEPVARICKQALEALKAEEEASGPVHGFADAEPTA